MGFSTPPKCHKNHRIETPLRDLSEDKRLDKLLKSVLREVKLYAEDQIKHIKQLTKIGLALSAEKNISRLLEHIVDDARDLSNADAGTLYIMDSDKAHLRFEILQNESMNTRMGGSSGVEITLPSVPLYVNDRPNHSNVSSYSALTGEIVNISDVYETEGFDFTGPRKYDATTGYRSKSMLVIPLRNHENEIIGVLQLLNARLPETGEVVAFSTEYEDLIASLASQAAVALTNTQLILDLRNLLYSFVKSIAAAIDEKSPYTGGHINRVVDLSLMIANKINETEDDKWKDVHFTEDELEELRLAAWMHDVGKITTPENVVDKSTKLEGIVDRIHHIETRFNYIAKSIENKYLKKKLELLSGGGDAEDRIDRLDEEFAADMETLDRELEYIKSCNKPGEFMEDDKVERIIEIANKTYIVDGEKKPYLSGNEVENLCIRKGSLTNDERKIIENHAMMTLKILSELPFPRKLANVPEYAGGHHEKLDGSGYPRHLNGDVLPWQSRIMAIADIFEALTARDRPYKKPMKLSQALNILGFMKKDRHIDPDILDLFLETRLYEDYAKREMKPEQVDI
jgi:HD-GYP domain-containing protein (c-di-GMP phosphodiesterase class II)